ncbi:BTB/POZ and TAZ domain-containing protein 2-like [Iris pallida]|uniref:BTB/POZ and TAZ domain-containing protein 2-like n=1 Tax=Iris pallida TaxID=29817 RepID=A0AAX6HPM9_IRIPA|nr:BTB/POZ and TAZ domain-containing protein 2-like [Iris pallida]
MQMDSVVEFRRWHEKAAYEQMPRADTQVVTSGGLIIPAHSNVLASASPVLERIVYRPRKHWQSERVVQILGVPSDAVVVFLQFLYSPSRQLLSCLTPLSSEEGKGAIEKYGIQLLALSHKYRVEWLKRGCEVGLAQGLTAETVVDVFQIAKLCDASRLYRRCAGFVYKDFPSVQQSEGWRFVQKNDPRLELEMLQYVQDVDQRKKRWWRQRADQEMYRQLSEAMECLEHICTQGCTIIGPHDKDPPPTKNRGAACPSSRTCEGLQLLIRHFATCSKRLSPEAKRMWQLFRLHSIICDLPDSCKVPLCKQFKTKGRIQGKGDDAIWRLLAKKVVTARAMSSLAKRERVAQLRKPYLPIRKGTKLS